MAISAKMDELYHEAMENFTKAVEAESENRQAASEDLRFYAGVQWPDVLRRAREMQGRPVLTFNRFPALCAQVINEARMGKVSLKVLPVDSGNDVEDAKVREGLIRAIEYQSSAEAVYESALEGAVTTGVGHFRIITDYANADTFDQDIFIKRIIDPFSVYWDVAATDYDKRDAKWCFVCSWIDEEEFERRYPKDEGNSGFEEFGAGDNHWAKDGLRRIAEYYYKEVETGEIWEVRAGNGETRVIRSEDVGLSKQDLEDNGIEILRTRKVERTKVYRCVLGGGKVLEKAQEIPSQYIPVIPVTGPEVVLDGKRHYWSLIRHSKDAQRLLNYQITTNVEKIALTPKTPTLMTPKQVLGFENYWAQANQANFSYLLYNPDPEAPGQPQRLQAANLNAAEIQLTQQADNELKATTGIFDASLGQPGNEQSGVAIEARQSEGDTSTYTWIDNLHRSIEHCGRIILDMIPRIYDVERTVRIVGKDESDEWVKINEEVIDPLTGQTMTRRNMVDGKYDIQVSVGPHTKTQRQEAQKNLLLLVQAMPQLVPVVADMVVETMDWDKAKDAAERIRMALGIGDGAQTAPPEPTQEEIDKLTEAQIDLANKKATLEGKQLINIQRKMELSGQGQPDFVAPPDSGMQ